MATTRKKRLTMAPTDDKLMPMNGDVAAFAAATSTSGASHLASSSTFSPTVSPSLTKTMSFKTSLPDTAKSTITTTSAASTSTAGGNGSSSSNTASVASSSDTSGDVYAEARSSGNVRKSLSHRARALDAYNNQSISSRSRLLACESSRLLSPKRSSTSEMRAGSSHSIDEEDDDLLHMRTTSLGSSSGGSSSGSRSSSTRRMSSLTHKASSRGSTADLFGGSEANELMEEVSTAAASRVLVPEQILMLEAVIVLWRKQRMAMAMRRWFQVVNSFSDPEVLMQTMDIKTETRQLLLLAEKKRIYDPLHPKEFSRKDLDICLAWAKMMQAKTFQGVDDPSIKEVVKCLRFRHYEDGQVLFFEGDVGNTFYIVFNGTVAVYVGLNKSATEYKTRRADVVAAVTMGTTHVQMMRQASQRALTRSPSSRMNLAAMKQTQSSFRGGGNGDPNGGSMRKLPTTLKSTKTLMRLNSKKVVLENEAFDESEEGNEEEEDPADYYFVCSVVSEPVSTERSFLGKRVYTYRTGESFGETVMFTSDAIRTASAVAIGPCDICEVTRDVYKRTLRKFHQEFFEQAQRLNFLQRVAIFSDWPRNRLAMIAQRVNKIKLNFGNQLLVENVDLADTGFFILSGQVKILRQMNMPSLVGGGMETSKDEDGNPIANSLGNIVKGGFGLRRFGKQQHRIVMQMEVDTLGPGEIICVESFLTPSQTSTTTTGTSATSMAATSTGLAASVSGMLGTTAAGTNGSVSSTTLAGLASTTSTSAAAGGTAAPSAPKITYTVQAASAVVELYALADSDARAFFSSAPGSFIRQLQRLARDQHQRRSNRLDNSTRAIMAQQKHNFEAKRFVETLEAAQRSDDALTSAIVIQDLNMSMPIGVLPYESAPPSSVPAGGQVQSQPASPPLARATMRSRPGVAVAKETVVGHEDTATTMAHASAPSTALGVRSPSGLTVDTKKTSLQCSDPMQVAMSPRMLSTCAKKFVFEHSEALEPRFVEHFKSKFPDDTAMTNGSTKPGTSPTVATADVIPPAISMEAATVVSNSLAPSASSGTGASGFPPSLPLPSTSLAGATSMMYSPRSPPAQNLQITTLLHPATTATSPLSHHTATLVKSNSVLSRMEQDVFVIKSRLEQAEYYQVLQQQFKSVADRKTIQFESQTTPFNLVQQLHDPVNPNQAASQGQTMPLAQRVYQACPLLHHHQQRHGFSTKHEFTSRATDLTNVTSPARIHSNVSPAKMATKPGDTSTTTTKSSTTRSPVRAGGFFGLRAPPAPPKEEEVIGISSPSRLHQKLSHQNANKGKTSSYTSTARRIVQSHFKKLNGQERTTSSSDAQDHDSSNFVHFF